MPKTPRDTVSQITSLVDQTSLVRQMEELTRQPSLRDLQRKAMKEFSRVDRSSIQRYAADAQREVMERALTVRGVVEDLAMHANPTYQLAQPHSEDLARFVAQGASAIEDSRRLFDNESLLLPESLAMEQTSLAEQMRTLLDQASPLIDIQNAAQAPFARSVLYLDAYLGGAFQNIAEKLAKTSFHEVLSKHYEQAIPDWERLTGTSSIQAMLQQLATSSSFQSAVQEMRFTHEDLRAEFNATSIVDQFLKQASETHLDSLSSWGDIQRWLKSVDWEVLADAISDPDDTGDGEDAHQPEAPAPAPPDRPHAAGHRQRTPLSFDQKVALASLIVAILSLLITTAIGAAALQMQIESRSSQTQLPDRGGPSPTDAEIAIVVMPTVLRQAPQARAKALLPLAARMYVRILDEQAEWAQVDVAEGPQSGRTSGWVPRSTIKPLSEALFEETFQQLQAAFPETPASKTTLPTRRTGPDVAALPAVIAVAGTAAGQRYVEYFTASLRNRNTRAAYWHACNQFLGRCEEAGLTLDAIQPVHVAGYIEHLSQSASAPTVKQHLAAIRRMFDFLVVGQILPANPAASVRGPKHVVSEGKTPILEAEEVRTLFAQFDDSRLIDLRDRAILGAMVYSFARVGAVAKLRVKDYYRQGARAWFVLDEKGGKQNRVPAHHQAAEYVEQYLAKAVIELQRETPLFRSLGRGRGGQAVTERGLRREEIFAMVRRRTAAVGLPTEIGCHSFRGTGITNYLKNGGTIETAARLAGHASTRTTQLYDRRLAEVAQAEVERIRF